MNPINPLIAKTIGKRKQFLTSRWARMTPFIEQTGSGLSFRKEFWWEPEGRHCGDFGFSLDKVIFGFSPQERVAEFERYTHRLGHKIPFVDPNWNLENFSAHVCGCTEALTPFTWAPQFLSVSRPAGAHA